MLTLLVAAAANNAIGRHNELPWRLPTDLKWFKQHTLGRPIVMGRKTFDSIARPLPGRTTIVVTHQRDWRAPVGVLVTNSVEDALQLARQLDEDVFVVGGAELYRQTLPLADRILLTRVHADVEADAFFPELNPAEWQEVFREDHPADERHPFAFSFLDLRRKPAA